MWNDNLKLNQNKVITLFIISVIMKIAYKISLLASTIFLILYLMNKLNPTYVNSIYLQKAVAYQLFNLFFLAIIAFIRYITN